MKRLIASLLIFSASVQAVAAPTKRSGQIRTRGFQQEAPKTRESFALSLDPLMTLVYGPSARAEFFITPKLSVGPQITYGLQKTMDASDSSTNNSYNYTYREYNLGANYMLTGLNNTDGLYMGFGVGYVQARITNYSSLGLQGELAAPQARGVLGYQWVWDSGLRIGLGGGLRLIQSSDIIVEDNTGKEVSRQSSSSIGGLALDFTLGFVF